MGSGNQFIRTRDGEHARTFYFDPYGSFEETKKDEIENKKENLVAELIGLSFAMRRRKLEQMMLDGRYPVKVSDERVYDIQRMFCDDEIDNLSFEVGSLDGFARIPAKERKWEGELAAGYNDAGQVIAESDNCQVVIADNECNIAIACIPADSRENSDENVRDQEYDSLRDEVDAELDKDYRREIRAYPATSEEIDDQAEKNLKALQEKKWEEYLAKFKTDANAAMRKIHEHFGTQSISVRSCAWTSSRLAPYEELTEEERNDYY